MWIDFNKENFDLEILRQTCKEDWQKSIFSFLENWYDKSLDIEIGTSGTTSRPKKIRVQKKQMMASAQMSIDYFSIGKGSKILLCLSMDFIASKMLLVRAIVVQSKVFCIKASSQPMKNLFTYSSSEESSNFISPQVTFDFTSMVPLQAANSINQLNQIKILLLGGAPISVRLEEELQKISSSCYLSYAMSETLGHVALRKINGKDKFNYFRTLPGVSISQDERKCLKIFHPQIIDKAFQSNDLVDLISPTQFRWLGRYDYLINSGGIKIIPEIWEEKLGFFIKPRFFISSIADEYLGEKIILVLEGDPFEVELPKKLFEEKNKFYKPKKAFFTTQFEETFSGKIKRKETLQKINLEKAYDLKLSYL